MGAKLGNVAAALGKGLFAAGTVAMTVSSTVEMKLRGRGASSAPAQAAVKMLGVQPVNEGAEARSSNLVHWGYVTAWGGARGPPRGGRSLGAYCHRGPPCGGLGLRAGDAAGPGRGAPLTAFGRARAAKGLISKT